MPGVPKEIFCCIWGSARFYSAPGSMLYKTYICYWKLFKTLCLSLAPQAVLFSPKREVVYQSLRCQPTFFESLWSQINKTDLQFWEEKEKEKCVTSFENEIERVDNFFI